MELDVSPREGFFGAFIQVPVLGFDSYFIGMHRNTALSPMEEGARVHHSYGSYAPSSYGSMNVVEQI